MTQYRLSFFANVTFNGSSVAAETQRLSVRAAVATSLACGNTGSHGRSSVVVCAERTEQVHLSHFVKSEQLIRSYFVPKGIKMG